MPDAVPPARSLRLMSDYSCGWPLWGEGMRMHGRNDDGAHLGLSADTAAALRGWQEFFESRFHWDDGWTEPGDAAAYERTGRELLARLHAELPDYAIELDLWPVDKGTVGSWESGD
ncbi:MAG: hypothetical protein QM728_01315 [Gordonia sp. (in: high G+C Gram-positive bacteria)]|uniref:hypothetical protein n=1 Tax=Gordonia sp. (in: high G+C Gram-positive bacteria) TaxID=84139 RepID=UPI0039E26771